MKETILIIGISYENQFSCSCTVEEDVSARLSPQAALKVLVADKMLSDDIIEHILIVRSDSQEGFRVTARDI